MTDLQPCPTCPWRKSAPVGGSAIPGFQLALMRKLKNTVGSGDAIRPIMACHYSKVREEFACRGYIAVVGYSNIACRILASQGKLPLVEIEKACEGLDLFPDFETMLAAYEAAA